MLYGGMNFPIKPVLEEVEAMAKLGFDYLELAMDPDKARQMRGHREVSETDHCTMCGKEWCSVRISKELRGKS